MIVMELWDLIGIVGVMLVLIGLAVLCWPLSLVAVGSAMVGAYYVHEVRNAAQPVDAVSTTATDE